MAERTDLATRRRAEGETDNRSAQEIRQDIAAKRESISETVDKLGNRIQQSLDWREYVVDYPLASLGIAAGLGFLVSRIFRRKPTPRERIMDALAEVAEDMSDRFRSNLDSVVAKQRTAGSAVKAAATTMITKAAVDFAKKKLGVTAPGQTTTGSGWGTSQQRAAHSSNLSHSQAYSSSDIGT
ncbi:MAG TPA: hypothetical protein VNO14_15265 [Blastocatellia bacterium]|nr:hypothetical protein [Blastocatellia bacterium]